MPEYKRRFTFYESFYRATKYMTDAQELEFYRAMSKLAFDGEEPEFDDPLLLATWETVSNALLTGIKASESGRKGGTSKGASKASSKPTVAFSRTKGGGKSKLDEMYGECVEVI